MATLLYKGRTQYKMSDVVTPSGLHLRVRAGDIVEVPDSEVDWLLGCTYRFVRTDEPARRAVNAHDVQHDASVQLGGQ